MDQQSISDCETLPPIGVVQMADDKKTVSPPATGLGSQAARDKAKATRAKNAINHVDLDSRGKFALAVLQQAGRGCKILQEQIKSGKMPDASVLSAATTLSGVAAQSM